MLLLKPSESNKNDKGTVLNQIPQYITLPRYQEAESSCPFLYCMHILFLYYNRTDPTTSGIMLAMTMFKRFGYTMFGALPLPYAHGLFLVPNRGHFFRLNHAQVDLHHMKPRSELHPMSIFRLLLIRSMAFRHPPIDSG